MDGPEWTLSEVSKLLKVSQHRLIYLCESRVVNADIEDPKGRGSSRRFSARNLLEFALALRLKDLMLPVAAIAAVVYVLRKFEVLVTHDFPHFKLPHSLRQKGAIDLRIILRDGRYIYFALCPQMDDTKLYGGLDLLALAQAHIDPPLFHRQQLKNLARMMERVRKVWDPLSRYLDQLVPRELDHALQSVKSGRLPRSRVSLIDELNERLLIRPTLYDPARIAEIPMVPRVQRLINARRSETHRILVNRFILQLAFRKELGVSHRLQEWLAALAAEPTDQIQPVMLTGSIDPLGFGAPEGSRYTRIEVSVNNIARDLPLG